jgi:hypothetical protein
VSLVTLVRGPFASGTGGTTMGVLLGAFKGVWRGLLLLVFFAVFPSLAWWVAAQADGALGLGFTTIFLLVLALEGLLGIAALFGIATEVEKRHSQAMDEAAGEQIHR